LLFNLVLQASPNKRERLLDCIQNLASVTVPAKRSVIFRRVLQKLLESLKTKSGQTEALLDVISALTLHLDSQSIALLWKFILKTLTHDDQRFQKKVYQIVTRLFQNEFVSAEKAAELLKHMFEGQPNVHSRKQRLSCLKATIHNLSERLPEVLTSEVIQRMLGETIVFIKDSNLKVREEAYGILAAVAKYYESSNNFCSLLNELAVGLVCTSPYYQSGTISCLSRVLYDSTNQVGDDVVQELAELVAFRFLDSNSMTTKAALNFFKVTACCLEIERLNRLLPTLLKYLCCCERSLQQKFRRKFRSVIEIYAFKTSLEKVTEILPPTMSNLLSYIAREGRRRAAKKISGGTTQKKKVDFENMLKDTDEKGEEMKEEVQNSGVQLVGNGELNLLERNLTKTMVKVGRRLKDKNADPFVKEKDGKIIVEEEKEMEEKERPKLISKKKGSRKKKRRIHKLEEEFASALDKKRKRLKREKKR